MQLLRSYDLDGCQFTIREVVFVADKNTPTDESKASRHEAWRSLRGAMKDVYAEFGGGEAYLRWVRADPLSSEDDSKEGDDEVTHSRRPSEK